MFYRRQVFSCRYRDRPQECSARGQVLRMPSRHILFALECMPSCILQESPERSRTVALKIELSCIICPQFDILRSRDPSPFYGLAFHVKTSQASDGLHHDILMASPNPCMNIPIRLKWGNTYGVLFSCIHCM